MYCRKCGNELYAGDLFCNRCGAPVNPEQSAAPSAQGLAPGARDSERIIDEFYKSNKRREEAQTILNMEYSSIKEAQQTAQQYQQLVQQAPQYQQPVQQATQYQQPAPQVPQQPAPQVPQQPKVDVQAPQAPRAPKYSSKMVDTPHIFNVKIPEPKPEPEPPKIDATPQAPRTPQYASKMVDTPHIMHIKSGKDAKQAAQPTQQPAPQQPAPQQSVQQAPQQAAPQYQQPVQPAPQQAAPQYQQPVQPAPQQPAGATTMNQFDDHKASINQKAKVTLDMLDQLFADFNKPIAETVEPIHDLGNLAPATASGIATGKAIQKAVLDPEEDPPEEDFEDDDFFTDADDVASVADEKKEETIGKDNESAEGDKKKEKKGLFNRKAKDEPEEEDEVEEKPTSNIQKRPNVIVLNPEFLNEDEKASGKHTEDFRIASNMTHGVKAMDRVTPNEEAEDDTYYVPERSGNVMRKVVMGILTALLLLAAVISILITFGRDTKAGQAVLNFWDNIKGVESEEEEQESEAELNENGEEANGEEGEATTPENHEEGGEEEEHNEAEQEEQQESEEGQEGSEETGDVTSGEPKHIVNEAFNAAEGGFGESVQEPELIMDPGRIYSLTNFEGSTIFVDKEWYTDENGESVTYNDAIFYTVTDYYEKLVERMNKDSEEVLELIVPDTKLMTDVSGIKADAIVLHAITKLEVGEARTLDDNYYVLVQINEVTNDGRAATTYKRVLRLIADEETHTFKIAEVVVAD